MSQDEEIVGQWEARTTELTEIVETLKQQVKGLQGELEEQEREANEAISQWQENCSDLETKCDELVSELTQSSETIASRDWTIEQLKAENETFHVQIQKIKEASHLKTTIENDLVEATSEISRLTEVLENERQKRLDDHENLTADLAEERGRHAEAREEIETLTSALEEMKSESENIVNQWTRKYVVLVLH